MDQLPITSEQKTKKKRRFLMLLMTVLFTSVILIYGFYWWTVSRFFEVTDNAYVNGNIIPITTQVAGTIVEVLADNTQYVDSGQVLVKLDPIDTQLAFEQAKANLAETVRNTQQLYIKNNSLKASIQEREIALEKARNDLQRRKQAIGAGAVSREELTHAEESLKSANASLIQAQTELLSNRALTENTELRKHPNVLAAAAKMRQAYIAYMRTNIRAPAAGEISKRTAQVGEQVAAGTQLMALVPLEEVWVDANFKEKQIRHMRIGQSATLTADLYGSAIEYQGRVAGFSAGTGSAFALLPPQNATGNWIKVVQRLPVRIFLNPQELKKHPLRIGLSMVVRVDLREQSGKQLHEAPPARQYKTQIYENLGKEADEAVNQVIEENVAHTEALHSASAAALQGKSWYVRKKA